jgi:hypothetical protein
VQYGLGALNAGVITPQQFLDLNERVGGFDQDANYVTARSAGDAGAIRRAYQSGVTLGAGGGLASIPVFDAGAYNETERYHYQWFHFAVRERMRKQTGRAENHLMWRGQVPAEKSWAEIERWLTAISTDTSNLPAYEKVVKHKPVQDGCWPVPKEGQPPTFIVEPQTFGHAPDSQCNTVYPSYAAVRHVAGGPLDGNVLKCQLEPIDAKDYTPQLTEAQEQQLRRVFPTGVCDFSKPGVNQVPVVPWASFGPAPDARLVDSTN